jgi:O-antigen ligase
MALGIFALLVIAAPLLFGAVDRVVQLGLAAVLAIGIFALPPAVVPLSRWGNRLAIVLLVIFVMKEIAPASWFGPALWRSRMTGEFALDLPATHHPEPARALDAWLTCAVAVVWFLWVRRLAADRENRTVIAWGLFASAAIVAAVSFLMRGGDPRAIYGLRITPGWTGFGPFPNRNHTGDFLAMGAILGCGCVAWAASRKKWTLVLGGTCLLGLVLVALLTTQSRGGLIAFAIGLALFLTLAVLKSRTPKALGAALGAALFAGALGLAFGAQVLSRFHSEQGGSVSNALRVDIWRDAIRMWKDAPLFGHGVGSFAQIFPLYQSFRMENSMVLHPESSWLQWLAELGAVPVALCAVALLAFVGGHLRGALRSHGFFVRAAGFSAAALLLCHAVFDVPAHRWGTAAFALAALALACPVPLEGRAFTAPRTTALVPLTAAIFWAMPLLFDQPAWSPLTLSRLLARDAVVGDVPLDRMRAMLRRFPLNADLHQTAGLRQVRVDARSKPSEWQRDFAVAAQLVPGSWLIPAAQARAVSAISPGLGLQYWQQAIDRGGAHSEDVLRIAVRESADSPIADAAWGRYAEMHPELLLAYAQLVPEEQARYFYSLWWKDRALTADLLTGEIADFYRFAPRWGSRSQFDEWMRIRDSWRARDYLKWARLLHAWGDEQRAWELLADFTPEPSFPAGKADGPRPQLEAKWQSAPGNTVNAQQLAVVRYREGDTVQSDEIILTVAERDKAPPWFVQKAAHIYARNGRFGEAVAVLLKGG